MAKRNSKLPNDFTVNLIICFKLVCFFGHDEISVLQCDIVYPFKLYVSLIADYSPVIVCPTFTMYMILIILIVVFF